MDPGARRIGKESHRSTFCRRVAEVPDRENSASYRTRNGEPTVNLSQPRHHLPARNTCSIRPQGVPLTGNLSPERIAFAEAIGAFAERECGTREQRDQLTNNGTEAHSHQIMSKLAELGWVGEANPERDGVGGGGRTDACLLLEELASGHVPVFGQGIGMIAARAVFNYGTEEQTRRSIGGFCRGEISSVAMSEPESGSDVGSMSCRAERVDDGFVINGQKTWISCAHYAQRILLVCRTASDGSKHRGITMLEVPVDTPGVEIRPIENLGGNEINEVFFTNARVPAD